MSSCFEGQTAELKFVGGEWYVFYLMIQALWKGYIEGI